MRESDIIKKLGIIALAFPNANVSPETFKVYASALKDLEDEVFDAALQQALNGSKFFPTVAEIREHVAKIMEPLRLTAADGWTLVIAEVRRIGIYDEPKFDHEITAKCVEAIGWLTICNSEMEGVERAHFIKMFDQYIAREVEESKMLPAAKRIRDLHNGKQEQRKLTSGESDT